MCWVDELISSFRSSFLEGALGRQQAEPSVISSVSIGARIVGREKRRGEELQLVVERNVSQWVHKERGKVERARGKGL